METSQPTTPTETSQPDEPETSQSNQPNQSNQPRQINALMSDLKIPKPPMFDGSDTSLSNVNNWAFSVKEYIDLSDFPTAKHTRIAALFLDNDAKTWYRNNYANVDPPALDDFLRAFRDQFLITHSDDDIIKHLGEINQGDDPIGKYSTDFEMLVLQLGPTDPRLIKPNYFGGLNRKIRKPLVPTMTGKETLKDFINKATVIARNLEFEKGLEAKIEPKARSSSSAEPRTRFSSPTTARTSSSTVRASAASTSVSSINREMDSYGKFLMKLTEPEKDYIRKNRGCMNCRWPGKANHIASDCWEDHSGSGVLIKGKFLKKEHAKESSISTLQVVESESESDSEYSRPMSVSTIKIAAQVHGVTLPSTLADCGAMVNVIS